MQQVMHMYNFVLQFMNTYVAMRMYLGLPTNNTMMYINIMVGAQQTTYSVKWYKALWLCL